jgi:hypothetical protein
MKNISLFIICLILCACQQKNSQTGTENGIVINLDMLRGMEIRASDLFKSARTIILETKPECIIGSVDELQVFDREFYLLDRKGKSLFVFDLEGKFIRRIGKFGRGPGEYSLMHDFTLDPLNREIYVLDNGDKIHKYSVEGAYINSIQLRPEEKLPHFRCIQYFEGKIYAAANQLRNENYHILYVIDPASGKILSGHFSIADNKGWDLPVADAVFFNRLRGVPRFIYSQMNTVLSLDDLVPLIRFESEHLLLVAEIEEIKRNFQKLSPEMQLKTLQGVHNYMETEDFILLCYVLGNEKRTVVYRKDTEKVYLAEPFTNDFVSDHVHIVNIKCFDEKGAYEVVSMSQFSYYNKDSLLDSIDRREQLLSLNGEDNPIIFCYEFKDK